MSTPRRPLGPDRPHRLVATQLRVLAAELSDAGRTARGKRYWSDRAVTDIVVGHGVVTAEVLGSRRDPYVVTLEARAGAGAPSRSDVTVRCTCPDDDGWGRSACKHAVAALYVLGDEIEVEPDLLARWRRTATATDDDRHHERRHDQDGVDQDGADQDGADPDRDGAGGDAVALTRAGHPLGRLLRAPDGARLPPVPDLADVEHPRLADHLVADVLDDARAALRFRWD